MKTILFLILNLLLYFPLFGDEPIDPQNPTCTECNTIPHRYPHFYCDGNTVEKHTICLQIPIPDSQKQQMAYKCLMKRNGVLCFNFDDSTFPWDINSVDPNDETREESWDLIIRGTSTGPKIVFDIEDLDDSKPASINPIKRAFNEWNSVCERTDNPDSEENTCCVKLYFELDADKILSKNKTAIAYANSEAKLSEMPSGPHFNNCNYNCNPNSETPSFIIRFNATDEFIQRFPAPQPEGAPPTSLPKRFFISRDLIPPGSNIEYGSYSGDEMQFFDIYTVVLHELGHLLGFDHFTDKGENPCEDIDNSSDGVMHTPLVDNKRKELTWRDRCAYKRMYCCNDFQRCYNNVSVKEDENSVDGKIPQLYPNPTNTTLTIPYSFDTSLEFVVFAVDGTVVQTGIIPEGSDGFTFDVSTLSNGSYTLVLNSKKPIFRKFVISK